MRGAGGPPMTLYSACQPRLPEEILLVDDLARRPAELEVGEAHLALPLGARPARRQAARQRDAGGGAGPQEVPPLHLPSLRSHRPLLLCFRALEVHQDQRVHGHEPAGRRDQGIHVHLDDGFVVRQQVPRPRRAAPASACSSTAARPAKPPEERRPPPLGQHRARRLGRERREPDRHVAKKLGQHPAETDQHRGAEARVTPAADEELESPRHLLLHQERPRTDPRLERMHRPGQRAPVRHAQDDARPPPSGGARPDAPS